MKPRIFNIFRDCYNSYKSYYNRAELRLLANRIVKVVNTDSDEYPFYEDAWYAGFLVCCEWGKTHDFAIFKLSDTGMNYFESRMLFTKL